MSGFADESKSKGYIFSLVIVKQEQLSATRKLLREFVLPGQRSLHFSKESMARRREILDRILGSDLQLCILESGAQSHKEGRLAGLIKLSKVAQEFNLSTLCLERDDSTFLFDQRILREQLRQRSPREIGAFSLRYRHEEPILWAADALAWSYQKSGQFRTQLREGGVRVISY